MDNLKLSDKISVTVSVVALVVSISSFFYQEYKESHGRSLARLKNLSTAYNLGQRVSSSFVAFSQVRFGDPQEVLAAKEDALYNLTVSQGLSNSLELGIELRSLIEKYQLDKNMRSFDQSPSTVIEERVRIRHGKGISTAFGLGYWSYWGFAEALIAKGHKEREDKYVNEIYPKLTSKLNNYLKIVDLRGSILTEANSTTEASNNLRKLKEYLDEQWNTY